MECQKCGREKIFCEQAITGFPDYHVAGSIVEYCGFCDEPPITALNPGGRKIILQHNQSPLNSNVSCIGRVDLNVH